MSNTASYTNRDIQLRFFNAIDKLIAEGRLLGLKTFCDRYALNRVKYSHIRSKLRNPKAKRVANYSHIDTEALAYLCGDFGIRTEWLLLGKGKMREDGDI